MFLIDIYGLFLFGLVKLIFGLPKSEEYLPEGLPVILKFCEPWYSCMNEPSEQYADYTLISAVHSEYKAY